MARWIFVTLLAATAWACDSPTAPRFQPPSPPLEQTIYHLSGVVTDENFAPIGGAEVGLSVVPGGFYMHRTVTDPNGRYRLDFPYRSPPIIAVGASNTVGVTLQMLDWAGGDTLVKNLRIRRTRTVDAGESVVTSIDPDSSLCSWEFETSQDMICEWLIVRFEGPGTLTVEARSLDGGTVAPLVGWDFRGTPGAASFRLQQAGVSRIPINLAIDHDRAPQRYEVRTSRLP